jgi:DNA-directed RNA polymerase alpha subunit
MESTIYADMSDFMQSLRNTFRRILLSPIWNVAVEKEERSLHAS